MAKAFAATISLKGHKEFARKLKRLPAKSARKVMKAVVTAGAAPIVRATRDAAEAMAESHLTEKAVNRVVRSYKDSGNAVAVVGVSDKIQGTYEGRTRIPSNYWHLINQGVRAHSLGKKSALARTSADRDVQYGGQHPGFKGRNLLARAVAKTKGKSAAKMEAKLRQATLKAWAKR